MKPHFPRCKAMSLRSALSVDISFPVEPVIIAATFRTPVITSNIDSVTSTQNLGLGSTWIHYGPKLTPSGLTCRSPHSTTNGLPCFKQKLSPRQKVECAGRHEVRCTIIVLPQKVHPLKIPHVWKLGQLF